MALRYSEKHTRYTQLKIGCATNGWKAHPLCVEAGCAMDTKATAGCIHRELRQSQVLGSNKTTLIVN